MGSYSRGMVPAGSGNTSDPAGCDDAAPGRRRRPSNEWMFDVILNGLGREYGFIGGLLFGRDASENTKHFSENSLLLGTGILLTW